MDRPNMQRMFGRFFIAGNDIGIFAAGRSVKMGNHSLNSNEMTIKAALPLTLKGELNRAGFNPMACGVMLGGKIRNLFHLQ